MADPDDRLSRELTEAHDFSWALRQARAGHRLRRPLVGQPGWREETWFAIRWTTDEMLGDTAPYLYLHSADGQVVPWTPDQLDLLASDWALADDTA